MYLNRKWQFSWCITWEFYL